MGESGKSKRGEIREFWEEAVRLWAESGVPVREFCNREGLATHSFYSWRRELMPERPASKVNQEASTTADETPVDGRRRHRRKQIAGSDGKNTSAVEFLPVRVGGDEVSPAHAASAETPTGAASIEIIGTSSWRVRIPAGFDPAVLKAVLTVLEGRPC